MYKEEFGSHEWSKLSTEELYFWKQLQNCHGKQACCLAFFFLPQNAFLGIWRDNHEINSLSFPVSSLAMPLMGHRWYVSVWSGPTSGLHFFGTAQQPQWQIALFAHELCFQNQCWWSSRLCGMFPSGILRTGSLKLHQRHTMFSRLLFIS